MNDLGLTDNEVLNLCQWEGTRAAKERYEREARVQVRTTTADEIGAAPVGNGPRATFEDISRPASAGTASSSNETLVAVSQRDDTSSKDAELLPVPEDFIGLLRHAMQSRLQGDHAHINQAWEAWLKETLENHDEIDIDSVMTAIQNLEPETFGIDQQGGDGEVETPRSPTPQSPAAETYQEVTPIDQTQIDRFRRAGAHLLPRSQAETAR
ncbi:hypothetical protein H2200_004930 [Cladophialophora chaetospira]|uniref:Uncharacterized protein n=1 Tax=Cladophialophora chaetospira TaxID=386627 RepID=A0AA39CKZ6_9EURO|nr:hypothetical protein H2200_004930 [Cladophialophora chaetospira]